MADGFADTLEDKNFKESGNSTPKRANLERASIASSSSSPYLYSTYLSEDKLKSEASIVNGGSGTL